MNFTKISVVFKLALDVLLPCLYSLASFWWFLRGFRKPSGKEVQYVCKNVTFVYKSFERKNMAKRLYRNIQRFYPGAKVIIADDSKKPLSIRSPHLTVLQLPFNSGLSLGLNRALEEVASPYIFRMDDDELLTPFTQIGKQLHFLEQYPQVDLVGIQALRLHQLGKSEDAAKEYFRHSMGHAPKKLRIPHMTKLDNEHYIVGKCANVFLGRTEKSSKSDMTTKLKNLTIMSFFIALPVI